jgi:hypothetical protein
LFLLASPFDKHTPGQARGNGNGEGIPGDVDRKLRIPGREMGDVPSKGNGGRSFKSNLVKDARKGNGGRSFKSNC